MNWLGGNGFGATTTFRRDWLPGEIEGQYLHKKSSDKMKVERFFHPVVATKNTNKVVEKRTGDNGDDIVHVNRNNFQRVYMSFHFASSCNIRNVNNLYYCKTSALIEVRGQFNNNNRYWLIETNEARKLYLGTYSRIESIDFLIKNFSIKYMYWEYWKSPMLHAMYLAAVVEYNM